MHTYVLFVIGLDRSRIFNWLYLWTIDRGRLLLLLQRLGKFLCSSSGVLYYFGGW